MIRAMVCLIDVGEIQILDIELESYTAIDAVRTAIGVIADFGIRIVV